jgi:FkbM family methyltransferase
MSIFLFGSFQKHVTSNRLVEIPEDAVIFDVGANFGSISLIFAAMYAHAVIYSFEPTHYAFGKLKRNIELNEDTMGQRIIPLQTFVSASNAESSELTAYSSWPIEDLGGSRHPVHLGVSKDATDKQITLDTFVQNREISRLHLIKIDTDGHELDVLRGAMASIRRFRPIIIFELTTYLLREREQSFSDYEELLLPLGYRLFDAESSCEVRKDNLEQVIPEGGGIDVVAIPSTKNQ